MGPINKAWFHASRSRAWHWYHQQIPSVQPSTKINDLAPFAFADSPKRALAECNALIGRACNQWTRASRWHARTESYKLPRANTCHHLAMKFAHVHLSNALPVYHPLSLIDVTNRSTNKRQQRAALPAELKTQNRRVSWFALSNFAQVLLHFHKSFTYSCR